MALKPWREIAEPHSDVRNGKFSQAEFAADLSLVHAGQALQEYQDPVQFFQRTFITEGMRLLLDSVVKRLVGGGGDPVIQLQTAFGGGKTHTMLAVLHLAKGEVPASDLQGVASILDSAGITELPKAHIAVLEGMNLLSLASKPNKHLDDCTVKTLWGELAWQLGGAAAYVHVKEADQTGTAPGKKELIALLSSCAPCVVLVDELVRYVSQFEEGQVLSGGTYDTQLSFVQALTEAMKAVPNAVMLASLPQSEREAGSQQGIKALKALEHYFGRVQALWKPVQSEEAFEIVRRRLFSNINNKLAAESVCREFADYYIENKNSFPQETQESKYLDRLKRAYPIHPEVFDRLYEDWSSLEGFQRTRGVLKLMATVIHRLWDDGNNDALIMPGSFPLMDANTRNEAIYYLPPGWEPVIERDVDGDRSEAREIENKEPRFGSVQACRRVARTVFLGSAPGSTNQMAKGIELERVLLGTAWPGQQPVLFQDALTRLMDKLHHINHANNRFWLDTRANLRREMEERKRRFQDTEDVFPAIRQRIQRGIASSVFGNLHVFTNSADVPDDWALHLVVLPPDAAFSKTGQSLALERATEILKNRGEQPRFKQNRLLFIAADFESISRLKEHVRTWLSWQSIVSDYKDNRIVLDNLMARQAQAAMEQADETVRRTIRETYKWLLTPMQEARPGKGIGDLIWENHNLNASAQNWGQEIERVLKENELLISEWAPIHLAKVLKDWFWVNGASDTGALKVWQQSCQQLYLPRLKDDTVYQHTLALGAESLDFYGFAQGKNEDSRYLGFSYGGRTTPILDDQLLLIEPVAASAYVHKLSAEAAAKATVTGSGYMPSDQGSSGGIGNHAPTIQDSGASSIASSPSVTTRKKRFYGTIDLDPIRATGQFSELVQEVVQQFTEKRGVSVRIAIEIEAESSEGFDDGLQRAVRENCKVLNFKNAEFEEDDRD